MIKKSEMTHADIERAIAQFRAQGGLIHKLPDQAAVRKDFLVSSPFDVLIDAVFGAQRPSAAESRSPFSG
jgi:hypothetical protein